MRIVVKDRSDNQKYRAESGQAIAEFAIVFPVLLLLVLGVIQFSLMYMAKGVVEYAAYAAARAELVDEDPERAAEFVCSAISGPSYDRGSGQTITVPGWGVLPRSESSSIKTSVAVIDGVGNGSGEITVEVTHIYELVIPVVSMLFKPISEPVEPDDVPAGIFVTINDAPHIVLRSTYTRPVPWDDELRGVTGHPVIPDL